MASSVWSESMEMWRLPRRTFPSLTTMKRSKIEHFPFNIHTTKHLDSVTEKGTLQPSNSFLTSQHETPLSPPESGSPSSTFAASTSTKNVAESGRHNLSIESNHQFIHSFDEITILTVLYMLYLFSTFWVFVTQDIDYHASFCFYRCFCGYCCCGNKCC